jgi:hypothetical protein
MAQKKSRKPAARKRKSPPRAKPKAKAKVAQMVGQAKEPLSLLQTLKEEGLSNALTLLTLASTVAEGAKKNLRFQALRPQLKELVSSLGFAFREDLERLEARLDDLEHLLSEREYAVLGGQDEE